MNAGVVIEGTVIGGQQLGRRLGFPTANMDAEGVDVANGVYASAVEIDGVRYRAMSNVGVRPSVDGRKRLLETYVFDFDGDLYGRTLRVELLDKIRDERKFASVDELRERLVLDADHIRSLAL